MIGILILKCWIFNFKYKMLYIKSIIYINKKKKLFLIKYKHNKLFILYKKYFNER